MTIRNMTSQDIKAVVEVEQACFSHPWSEKSICDSFENNCNRFFVATENDAVVGYIGMSVMADEGYILNVAVLPQFRGKGFGKRLVEQVLCLAEKLNLVFVTLEVRVSNSTAISLYTSLGFEKVGERKNYYSNPVENALLLTKHYNSKKE